MISFNLVTAVYQTFQQRTAYLEGQKDVYLARRITATTPGSVVCPTCWDSVRQQLTNATCATCLGTGFLIPGAFGLTDATTQRGYQSFILFDAIVSEATGTTDIGDMGYVEQTNAILVWPDQLIEPKTLDVISVSNPLTAPVGLRYLVDTSDNPGALGGVTLLHKCTMIQLRREHPAYALFPADPTTNTPGTWS